MIAGFAGYSFSKAHAAAFAVIVYWSAWLRVHYPTEYFCGLLRNSPLGNGATAVRALDIAIRIEREILGRASADAKVGPGLAELLEAATKVPPKRVAEVRRQLAETVHGPTAAPAGQPAPETVLSLPAALAPCHVGEN